MIQAKKRLYFHHGETTFVTFKHLKYARKSKKSIQSGESY